MLRADMDRKALAITPPLLLLSSFFFHLRGAAFGSSKAFHCLLLLSCLLLSSVNTLHNLADYDSLGSNFAERFQSFNVGVQNVCPSSNLLFSLLPALGSEYHQFDPVVTFFSPGKSWSSSSALTSNNNLSGVVWLSLKPVHIIEFQPFTGFSRIGGGTKPLSKENTREWSISVSGNGLMEQKRCEGLSIEPGDSIKFLFFYRTELSCASGVAVFAVPMKSTAPVLMLSLYKRPVSWWLRAKKLLIALLIAVALLVLIFCFNDHFIEERNNVAVRKAEKPSTITISLEMDTLLRSISKETLQGSNEVVSENSIKPVASVSSCQVEETSELTVKTVKDKKRRRNKKKKKKGAVSELTTDVSSSQSGNSTPRSPLSPEPPAVVVTQAAMKPATTPKPVLSHSATFPVSGTKSMVIIQGSSLAPNARAPGAKSRIEVKDEEEEYRYYDIWGDHLTGLHLMDRFKEVREGRSSSSSSCFGEEDDEFVSLFVKGPHHNLLPGCSLAKPMGLIKK
ncbi:hypothetical protein HID58_075906 [Brassica napus]|uniref:BnaC07g16530D protein n=2 Tax=Brassica napus TaxID=3708 RepID=A0A078FEI0_BRANA|nr:uncharacterized protein BNAC07G16530D [Brassica napus]KAH0868884.1 hypothetical protein HID58_075906 [Brassica napus]CAF1985440.1 unnamed protein product [Brassica napus]CDY12780.1 BnaC07g16530D [Brassica napus]